MQKVVKACYGTYLSPNHKEDLINFRESYLSLDISVTPKVHAVMCKESIHHDFLTFWKNFKVKDLKQKGYEEKLFSICQHVQRKACLRTQINFYSNRGVVAPVE